MFGCRYIWMICNIFMDIWSWVVHVVFIWIWKYSITALCIRLNDVKVWLQATLQRCSRVSRVKTRIFLKCGELRTVDSSTFFPQFCVIKGFASPLGTATEALLDIIGSGDVPPQLLERRVTTMSLSPMWFIALFTRGTALKRKKKRGKRNTPKCDSIPLHKAQQEECRMRLTLRCKAWCLG